MQDKPSKKSVAFVTDKDSFSTIKAFCQPPGSPDIAVHIGDVDAAIDYIKRNPGQLNLLVDVAQSEFPVSEMRKLAEVCEPGTNVIVLGTRNEVGLFRDLIDLGASDYLVKPLTPALLARSYGALLGNVTRDKTFSAPGNIISFIGARGGVGSSTLAVNIAAMLSDKHNKHVSLVDLDPDHSSMPYFLEAAQNQRPRDLFDMSGDLDSVSVKRSMMKLSDHLSMISCNTNHTGSSQEVFSVLQKVFPLLNDMFHFTIFDLPWSKNTEIQNYIIQQSATIVLVVDMTMLSIRNASEIIRKHHAEKQHEQRFIVVANRMGEYKKGELSQKLMEESIQGKIDIFIPFDAVSPLEALHEGDPVVNRGGKLADGVNELCQHVLGRSASKRKGFFNQLFGKYG